MLFNLAFKNIRKSIKDYSIYFFTLVVAVAIFYIFNSIGSQDSMMFLTESKKEMVQVLVMIIGYLSVFVSVVLGFLIIYSNNFLIKRRKKELGLYLTLGMSKRKVSTILVIETLLVGILSLVVGLLVGVFISQFISIFTAKLFEADMVSFHFVFSSEAVLKTLLYFGIIFLLVMIFNIITLSRHRLITLLTASKQNEKVKFRNKYVVIISFILSVVLLGYAYNLLFKGTFFQNGPDKEALQMIVTGSLGTFLLFFSISGFALKLFQMRKKTYYKGLNMFTLKQVNSKVNTTVVSTTIICLMLLLTIGILSGSMSLSSVMNKDIKENNLTDFTLKSHYNIVTDNGIDVGEFDFDELATSNQFKETVKDYLMYTKYETGDIEIIDLVNNDTIEKLEKEYETELSENELKVSVPIMLESDYNNIRQFLGKKEINISDDEYLIMANVDGVVDYYTPAYNEGNTITLDNDTLKPGNKEIDRTAIENYSGQGNNGVVIVSDKYKDYLENSSETMIGNYVDGNAEELEKQFITYFDNAGYTYTILRTKIDMEASSVGMKAILTFLGLYLGIVFAISSATVLAIGQLSESSDNKERFRVLRQLGADERMIKKALFTQISIAFILPLFVAVIHAIFGLRELNKLVQMLANLDLTGNIILTSLFIIVVYGGYFLATYLVSKNIINEK